MKKETQERIKLTDAIVKNLPSMNNRYYRLDSECIGLRVYVQVTGAKAFYFQRYIKQFKYSKKSKLGDFPDMSVAAARKLCKTLKADNVQGKDPIVAAAERAAERNFGAIVQEYIDVRLNPDRNKKRPKESLLNEKSNLENYVLAMSKDKDIRKVWRDFYSDMNIKSKTISNISKQDIEKFHSAITTKATYAANRVLAHVRRVINYAKACKYFAGQNPASHKRKEKNPEVVDHHDFFSSVNMFKIITAIKKLRKKATLRVACNAILAALYCGGRPQSEVFSLKIGQIDFENKCIYYKKSKGGQWTRPITDTMIEHLKYIVELRSNADPVHYYSKEDLRHEYLFPNCRYGQMRRGKRGLRPCKLKHFKEVRKTWRMIKREAGVEHRDLKSLRHTFATYCLEVGVSMRMLQLYLGHRSIKTTELYGAISKALMLAENKKLTAAFNDSEAA